MKKNRRLFLILSVFTQLFSFAGAVTMLFKKNKPAAGALAVIGGAAAVFAAALVSPDKKSGKSSCPEDGGKPEVLTEKSDEEIVRDTEKSIASAKIPEQTSDDAGCMIDAAIDILKNASEPFEGADVELENELNGIEK